MLKRLVLLTVESSVHPAHIDQQTDHGHVHCSSTVSQKLLLQYLACLATPCHSVNVNVGECVILRSIVSFGEDRRVILKDASQELELNVFPPKWDAVFLLQMSDLVARIDGSNGAIGISPSVCHRHGVRWIELGRSGV